MKDDTHYLKNTTALLSSKWTLQVLYALKDDTKRYGEINQHLTGITQKMLTETVRKLEREGLVERIVHPVVPPMVEYRLTELGHSLLHTLDHTIEWLKQHEPHLHTARNTYDAKKLHALNGTVRAA